MWLTLTTLAAFVLAKFSSASPVLTNIGNELVDSTAASAAAAAVCGVPAIEPFPPVERIVGGIEAKPNSWPWMCSLEIKYHGVWTSYCGCSVLNSVTLLTAGQCAMKSLDIYDFRVRCGIHYVNGSNPHEQMVGVSNRTCHELYDEYTADYDVAILKLSTPLTFNDFVSPVCLPQKDVKPGTLCIATGWGFTSAETGPSNVLRQVTVPVVSHEDCVKDYEADPRHIPITDRMLCAGVPEGGKGVCILDGGVPLVTKRDDVWEIQGLGSFGYGCADKGFPEVYTHVVQLIDWIKQRL